MTTKRELCTYVQQKLQTAMGLRMPALLAEPKNQFESIRGPVSNPILNLVHNDTAQSVKDSRSDIVLIKQATGGNSNMDT